MTNGIITVDPAQEIAEALSAIEHTARKIAAIVVEEFAHARSQPDMRRGKSPKFAASDQQTTAATSKLAGQLMGAINSGNFAAAAMQAIDKLPAAARAKAVTEVKKVIVQDERLRLAKGAQGYGILAADGAAGVTTEQMLANAKNFAGPRVELTAEELAERRELGNPLTTASLVEARALDTRMAAQIKDFLKRIEDAENSLNPNDLPVAKTEAEREAAKLHQDQHHAVRHDFNNGVESNAVPLPQPKPGPKLDFAPPWMQVPDPYRTGEQN